MCSFFEKKNTTVLKILQEKNNNTWHPSNKLFEQIITCGHWNKTSPWVFTVMNRNGTQGYNRCSDQLSTSNNRKEL